VAWLAAGSKPKSEFRIGTEMKDAVHAGGVMPGGDPEFGLRLRAGASHATSSSRDCSAVISIWSRAMKFPVERDA